jgi:C-terminal processing protease CtpA/Prc
MFSRNLVVFSAFIAILSGCSNSLKTPGASSASDILAAKIPKPTSSPSNCDTTCMQRREEFRYVAYSAKEIYCYWDIKKAETGTDYDALALSLENSITTSTSLTDYYLLLRQWASAFHDGHVNVMSTDDLTGLDIYTAPIRVEVLAPATDHEKVIVAGITGVAGLSIGDEIVAVDGVATKDALTTAAAIASSGSTDRMRRFAAGRRLVDVLGIENGSKPFTISVKPLAGGAQHDVTLFRNVEVDPTPVATAAVDTGASYYSAQVLPNSIGYFRLDAFEGTQDDTLISGIMDRLAKTNGLILDLRKNGGGDQSGDQILSRLISKTITRYKVSERISDYLLALMPELLDLKVDGTGQFATWHDETVDADSKNHYGKPVVALISPYCFSACDTFVAGLKGNGLATLVGEPTGGGTGSPAVFSLPTSPFQFRYATVRGETPAGARIEGNGTQPDVYIEPTAMDRFQSKDTQLLKAIDVLQAQINLPPAPAVGPVQPMAALVAPVWKQNLNQSPTQEDNEYLMKLSNHDER